MALVIVCLQAYSCLAQQPPNLTFSHFSIEDGLSQVTARCIFEDEEGFIWIGTQDGLNRFDGYSFKIFRNDPQKPNSLSNGTINTIIQNQSGQLIVGTADGLNIYNKDSETFDLFLPDPNNPNSISNNAVTSLLEDTQGRLWIGTRDGLNLMDGQTSTFQHFYSDSSLSTSLSDNRILSLFEDSDKNIWIGTENGLNLFNEKKQSFTSYHHNGSNFNSLSSNEITSILQDHEGQVWIGTINGLNRFNRDGTTQRFLYDYNKNTSISNNHILSLYQDTKKNLWIATADGLNLFNYSSSTFFHYTHDPDDPSSLSHNNIWSIIEDQNGNYWIGVSNRGINFHDPRKQNFKHYKYQSSGISLIDNAVRSILTDHMNQLWVGSYTGLTVIDKENNSVKKYQHDPKEPYSLSANYILSLYQDNHQRIWLGTSSGLNIYDPKKNQFSEFQLNGATIFENVSIGPIKQDDQGNIWIGTVKEGLFRVNQKRQSISEYFTNEGLNNPQITSVFQDSRGKIWIGSNTGLKLFDEEKNTFITTYNDDSFISSNAVSCIVEGLDGRLWIGTSEGLHFLNTQTFESKSYRVKDGLSNDFIYGILTDDKGFVWVSTNNGLNRFDPTHETFIHYNEEDGLQSNEFNSRAYYKDKNGFLYFGGVNGLSVFHPDSIIENRNIPSVVLTDFLLFNQSVKISDTSSLTQSLDVIDEIKLDYTEDMFAFEFSALNYSQADKNQFAYKLEPFNRDWIFTGSKDRKAVFTRVPPGEYTFHVKASNDDGYWNEKGRSVKIRILPPWWLTWWAITLYVLISILTVVLIIYFQWRRIQLKSRLKLEQKEAEQFKVLDQLKTQFFSNITHEFRTPLTLIIGPSEQILKQPKLDESFTRTQIEMVLRNSRKFLHLINQLLDLSKVESKQMPLNLYQGDFTEFVKKIVEQFDSAAKQKKIRLDFSSSLSLNDYQFDRDKLDKILFNLLSNALKFTPKGGLIQVGLQIKEGADVSINPIVITIEDSGIGIPKDQLPKIFNRFYQVDSTSKRKQEGTGIGLALTKELVQIHDGSIEVKSEVEKGTTFTITLPLEISSDKSNTELVENSSQDQFTFSTPTINKIVFEETTNIIDSESEQPIVLIIEDNDDLRSFINSIMRRTYQTITAKDGIEGIEYALKFIPDLIISDVMMPGKDGFEVTHTLKSNPLSSHIPIILLTAKSTLNSRVKGLQEGANAYLTKPFNVEELTLVATQQIETRKLIQAKFANNNDSIGNETTHKKSDQELIKKLHTFIEMHLSNEELTVDELVKEVAMSHSQLYRKIKALTDLSIASFIRNYRLIRALEFLKEGEHNVTEVATMTGFGDRRYFHKVFTDKFNYPPSKILKK